MNEVRNCETLGTHLAVVLSLGLVACGGARQTEEPTTSLDGGRNRDGGSGDADAGDRGDAGSVNLCGPSPTSKGGDMCLVPEGAFMMGCNAAVDDECAENELPGHDVFLPSFHIDRFPVTMAEYRVCVDDGGCTKSVSVGFSPEKEQHPMTGVDWSQAASYCRWAGKRLPTEAEWEKAARGTDGRKYPWGNDSLDCEHVVMKANGCHAEVTSTMPVGSRPKGVSPYGAEDMLGNAHQWVHDWYAPYESGDAVDPHGPESGSQKVIRGARWNQKYASFVRVSVRAGVHPADGPIDYYGFRCAYPPHADLDGRREGS